MIPCLCAVAAKGYSITNYFCGNVPGEWTDPQWEAEKDGRAFSATSPEELLGLISMWEIRGDDWRIKEGEADFYDQFVEVAVMYDAEGNIIDS